VNRRQDVLALLLEQLLLGRSNLSCSERAEACVV
jgi:hypothetical protein